MRSTNHTPRLGKITTVTTTVLCLLCFIPQQGLYAVLPIQEIAGNIAMLAKEMNNLDLICVSVALHLNQRAVRTSLEDSLAKSFENLAITIGEATDSYATVGQFFQNFVDQINAQRKSAITIKEACYLIRQKIDSLQIPFEYREHLLLGLNMMSSGSPIVAGGNSDNTKINHGVYWPWEWNWFGLNKKDKKHDKYKGSCELKIGKWEVIAFGLFCCAVVLVAVYAPTALSVIVPALTSGSKIFFDSSPDLSLLE
jgi:hypothetical protein